jgi:hypothetical protein
LVLVVQLRQVLIRQDQMAQIVFSHKLHQLVVAVVELLVVVRLQPKELAVTVVLVAVVVGLIFQLLQLAVLVLLVKVLMVVQVGKMQAMAVVVAVVQLQLDRTHNKELVVMVVLV